MGKMRPKGALSHLKTTMDTLSQLMVATKELALELSYYLIFQERLEYFCVKSNSSVSNIFFFKFLKILCRPIKTCPQAPGLLSLKYVIRLLGLRKLFTPTGSYHPLLPRGMRDAGKQ